MRARPRPLTRARASRRPRRRPRRGVAARRAPRTALAALVAGALLAADGAPARAQEVEPPRGSLGVLVGARQNVGAVADGYRLGLSWGLGASYHLASDTRPIAVGGEWSLVWSRFSAGGEAAAVGSLSVLEMSFGLRPRFRLAEGAPHFATASLGATLYRANHPVPPGHDRAFIGPYAGAGADVALGEDYLMSLEARYGLIAGGPTSLLFLAGVAFGR